MFLQLQMQHDMVGKLLYRGILTSQLENFLISLDSIRLLFVDIMLFYSQNHHLLQQIKIYIHRHLLHEYQFEQEDLFLSFVLCTCPKELFANNVNFLRYMFYKLLKIMPLRLLLRSTLVALFLQRLLLFLYLGKKAIYL